MKTLAAVVLALFATFNAHAEDAPLTAHKSYYFPLNCRVKNTYYEINFENYTVEVDGKYVDAMAGATVKIENEEGKVRKEINLQSGEFEFDTGEAGIGGGFFYSRKARLNLRNCVSPIAGPVAPGGFSIGN